MSSSRLLIVEDDDILARIISWRLTNLGYEVCGRAASGAETLEFLKMNRPDLVLMDINIQGDIDGIETTDQIRKEYNIPVVYLTSHSDGRTLERAKATNPDGFILKPFGDNELRIAIELAMNR